MGQPDLVEPLDPPEVDDCDIPRLAFIPNKQWHAERVAFYRLRPSLLATHQGQYVAILGGTVVGSGETLPQVSLEAHRRCGEVPIYIGLASEKPVSPIRVPSARNVSR